jgi:erythromycin esterase-like protein
LVANNANLTDALRGVVTPYDTSPKALDPLMDLVGEARYVLIGEASHGTHEFYRTRAQLTKRLIREKGFTAVAVEADWPDAWRVNRFVRGFDDSPDANDALGGFKRFPQWMWRNADVLDFAGWLREYNDSVREGRAKCGFYGIDLYSLNASIRAVLEYLDQVDHAAATRARYRYSCFEDFGEDPQAYGYSAAFDLERSCRDQVVGQLLELQKNAGNYARRDRREAEDGRFFAEQNARLVVNAERYYRTMFEGHVSSWNLRDRHMADTVEALTQYLDPRVGRTKVAVWAHNSHLGDARATDAAAQGEWNVGQLVRQAHPDETVNIGFSTYAGTVTAADDWDSPAQRKRVRPSRDWDSPAQRKRVRPGMAGSYEALFHEVGESGGPRDFILRPRDARGALADELRRPRLQRAIGVIYRPQTERVSHYFHARLADQFDAVIHIDETRAVEALEREPLVDRVREEETYPSGV